jgi:diguanylate cyclase (GGDEF)-like protein
LAVSLIFWKFISNPLRWMLVVLQLGLSFTLLTFHHVHISISDPDFNAVLFTVYLGCCLHFWYTHRRWSAGAFITIGGFFAWAMVFVIAPATEVLLPNLHLESEVWNLPKYVVAVGMLLLLLENQIERTEYLALHDDLTKLANRRLFQDRLMNAMERARRCGSSMGLLQMDLDRFKAVNDTFGHHMGDLLLQEVARRLDSRVRRSDTLSRTGGDEFSLVLEEPTLREDAETLADTLERMLSQPYMIAGKRIEIGASIGVAIYPDDALDFESLCIAADQRMYQRKASSEPSAASVQR